MRNEVLQAVRDMVSALVTGPVVIGSVPPLGGYAVGFVGGTPRAAFWTLNSDENLPVLLNGKGVDQGQVADEMDAVHLALTTSKVLPCADDWQIYAIETTAAPQLIGREENTNWIYGSSFLVKFYAKGVKNA